MSGFPSPGDHERRWADLAHSIAAERHQRTHDPAALRPPEAIGELNIIGSGIETAGFSLADEALLRRADHVFYCVADPATVVWLKDLRPDAYDLYVLYHEDKARYVTYMEMTEAILYFVRKGRSVVAVFYGHPGIFVLSTHRAVRVARREGHRATMRAAVSALDTLCADLGVDPSQPGLQTFEATDMLIRRRRLDTGLHVVLWQVGVVGELGYRRQGFLNQGFGVLIDYLEDTYGPSHPVINYIGARYPGVSPTIDSLTMAQLRRPQVQQAVTGISTFYIPPRDVAGADPDMLRRLGLLADGQSVRTPSSPLRVIDRYDAREMKAFRDLADFEVPASYHWQEDTPASRFLLALRADPDLCDLYRRDPQRAFGSWDGAQLSTADQALLATRQSGAVQLAAKGLSGPDSHDGERRMAELLSRRSLARQLLTTARRAAAGHTAQVLDQWGADQGFAVEWRQLSHQLDRYLGRHLHPWAGLYLGSDGSPCIAVTGGRLDNQGVLVNGRWIGAAHYRNGCLWWRAEEGNPNQGHLYTDVSRRQRRLVGTIWPAGQDPSSGQRVVAVAQRLPFPGRGSPVSLYGAYRIRAVRPPEGQVLSIALAPAGVTIQGQPAVQVDQRGPVWQWAGGPPGAARGQLTALVDPLSDHPWVFGHLYPKDKGESVQVRGMIPLDGREVAALTGRPRFGIPTETWRPLITRIAQASGQGGLPLWHTWHNAVSCLDMVQAALRQAATVRAGESPATEVASS